MEIILLSSQAKADPTNFRASYPVSLRGVRKIYLVGYAFKDTTADGSNTGGIVVEIDPFRFSWISESGLGEGRLTLPSHYGTNEQWFATPLLIADATKHAIPVLKDLQVRAYKAYGTSGTSAAASLTYLHLWLGYTRE